MNVFENRFNAKFVKAMESGDGDGDSFEPCSSRKEKVNETVADLLEECWFFDNLLKKRSRMMMLRCNSDPCPSSSNASFAENKKEDGVVSNGLIRTPSLPTWVGRKEEKQQEEEISSRRSKVMTRQSSNQTMLQAPKLPSYCNSKLPCRKLQKAPSLPPLHIGREDIISCQENDSDARMSRLIRLAFANSTETLNPRHYSTKGVIQSYNIPRAWPPRSSEVESDNTNGIREMSRRYLNQQKMVKKSLNDLETEEVQGFKDLGFTFEKKDLSPCVVNILPGLQAKKQEEESSSNKGDKMMMRRPYLSEAWLVQSTAPPVPNCVPNKNNSAQDMKAQLKFWARAVASNVRQEC